MRDAVIGIGMRSTVLMACALALALGACGPVAGNYPETGVRKYERIVDPTTAPATTNEFFTIRVGRIYDPSRMRAAVNQTHRLMAEGMGESAFRSMKQDSDRMHQWRARPDTFRHHTFYRAGLDLHRDCRVVFEKGALLLTLVTAHDTTVVADDGILFMKHDQIPLECRLTVDGPVVFDRTFNGVPLNQENRLQILLRRNGRVIAVETVPEKIRILDL